MTRHALDNIKRMIIWLLLGLVLYASSYIVGHDNPQGLFMQTILYKLGHVTTLAWVGYWIARMAIGRVDLNSRMNPPYDKLARAVIIAGVIMAGSMGL